MTEKEAEEIAERAVKKVLTAMGVNISSDSSVIEMQKDFNYLRETRLGKDELMKKGKAAAIGVFITATAAVLLKGAIAYFKSGG